MSKLNYFSSENILALQELFRNEMLKNNINKEESSVRQIREFMFEFFDLPGFKDIYFKVAEEIIDSVGLKKDNAALQMLPTPRVFRPGSIGTSYHCDYWYGHGALSYTVWLPLTELNSLNTFKVINSENPEELYSILESQGTYENFPEELIDTAVPVLPSSGEAFVFSSKLLHGSPLNSSQNTRLSFDFRISPGLDPTSTKDLDNYYHFKQGKFALMRHELDGKRVLKYVCGGKGKNTFLQHIIIEAAAKRFNMNVYEQEAEIERFGYPLFRSYVEGKKGGSDLQAIIIASKNILNQETIDFAKNTDKKIWCALENEYLASL